MEGHWDSYMGGEGALGEEILDDQKRSPKEKMFESRKNSVASENFFENAHF
jgi:hypothetical protein